MHENMTSRFQVIGNFIYQGQKLTDFNAWRAKMKKDETFVHLQGSALTFSGVVGKGVTVCFLLR